jgi:hypothetical protein
VDKGKTGLDDGQMEGWSLNSRTLSGEAPSALKFRNQSTMLLAEFGKGRW